MIFKSNRQLDTELYDKTLSQIQNQEVVEGTVVSINKREVVVNIGYKSDGVIPYAEFRYNPDLKVGDKVEVFIENQEDKKVSCYSRTNLPNTHVLGNR